jgi:hypothetical protein
MEETTFGRQAGKVAVLAYWPVLACDHEGPLVSTGTGGLIAISEISVSSVDNLPALDQDWVWM